MTDDKTPPGGPDPARGDVYEFNSDGARVYWVPANERGEIPQELRESFDASLANTLAEMRDLLERFGEATAVAVAQDAFQHKSHRSTTNAAVWTLLALVRERNPLVGMHADPRPLDPEAVGALNDAVSLAIDQIQDELAQGQPEQVVLGNRITELARGGQGILALSSLAGYLLLRMAQHTTPGKEDK